MQKMFNATINMINLKRLFENYQEKTVIHAITDNFETSVVKCKKTCQNTLR